jgi:hypothetical protein
MVSWQSVDDFRVMEYEAENAMVVKPSGLNEFRAFCSTPIALRWFDLRQKRARASSEPTISWRAGHSRTTQFTVQSVTQAGNEEEPGE